MPLGLPKAHLGGGQGRTDRSAPRTAGGGSRRKTKRILTPPEPKLEAGGSEEGCGCGSTHTLLPCEGRRGGRGVRLLSPVPRRGDSDRRLRSRQEREAGKARSVPAEAAAAAAAAAGPGRRPGSPATAAALRPGGGGSGARLRPGLARVNAGSRSAPDPGRECRVCILGDL